jgi:hypothetical protein
MSSCISSLLFDVEQGVARFQARTIQHKQESILDFRVESDAPRKKSGILL